MLVEQLIIMCLPEINELLANVVVFAVELTIAPIPRFCFAADGIIKC